ncbi:hypothetical protein EXS70_01440 [Candidatus Peribacteria bacterium]|nr:hypothetical protein [Candidatus Peribacteria bacterium]
MNIFSFIAQWNHFWFRSCPPHLLAVFRIIFGAFLLLYFGLQLPHVGMFFSRKGLLMPLHVPDRIFTVIFTPPSPQIALFLFITFLAFLFFFTIGLLTRVSAAVVFLLYSYYWVITLFQFGTSFDRLFLFTMLVLTFSGCGKTLSVDMKLRRGSFLAWEPISILPQRLLSVQIMMTYLGVGWQKLALPAWQTGKVLAYGFLGRWATPPAWAIARMNIPLPYYDALNWLIKAFECTLPFGLWSRRYRWWFFAGGALFHIMIALLLAIWWFLALIPAYILFLEPERIQQLVSRGRRDATLAST